MPTPDISNANVARVLRVVAHDYRKRKMPDHGAVIDALADALDAAPTWSERVERAMVTLPWYDTTSITLTRKTVDAALRLSFPELAPADD